MGSSFDRWMKTQKHKEASRNAEYNRGRRIRDCARGDYREIDKLWYSEELIRSITIELCVTSREAEFLWEAWQCDAKAEAY